MWISISLTTPVPDALILLSRPMFLLHQVNQEKTTSPPTLVPTETSKTQNNPRRKGKK